jgi:hypothetical protein
MLYDGMFMSCHVRKAVTVKINVYWDVAIDRHTDTKVKMFSEKPPFSEMPEHVYLMIRHPITARTVFNRRVIHQLHARCRYKEIYTHVQTYNRKVFTNISKHLTINTTNLLAFYSLYLGSIPGQSMSDMCWMK